MPLFGTKNSGKILVNRLSVYPFVLACRHCKGLIFYVLGVPDTPKKTTINSGASIMIKVRWLGAAGLEFVFQGKTILIDPFVSRYTMEELAAGPLNPQWELTKVYLDELPGSLAGIVMGHTHFDHALEIPFIAKNLTGPLVGSRSLETLMALHDMTARVTVCQGGERVELMPEAAVTMLLSKHGIIGDNVPYHGEIDPGGKPPLKVNDYKLGTIYMAKLELGGTPFMMAGSANFIPEQLVGQSCDVLYMCVVGWDKTPDYAVILPGMLKPKVIVPYHADNSFVPLPPDRKAPPMPGMDIEGFLETVSKSSPDTEIRRIDTFEYTEF